MTQVQDRRREFRPKPGEIPTDPGVYRFSDRHGRVLYIGKAKNLRNRLNSYFQPLEHLMPRTRQMLSLAAKVDWTVVATDTESLILEHTWITQFQPPYNVQFKDDKTYPYLAVTLGDESPRLIMTRNDKIRKARYFGPYPKVYFLREMMAELQKAFPIRTCNDADYRRAIQSGRPCLAGQIGRCFGPCSQKVTPEEHRERVNELVHFLSGHDNRFVKAFRDEMARAAEEMRYEDAAVLRDKLQAMEHVLEQNAVVLSFDVNADVFGFSGDELAAAVHQFIVRDGRIRGERSWVVDVELDDSPATLIEQVVQTAYREAEVPPPTVYVSEAPTDTGVLEAALQQQRPRKGRVRVQVPERGDKAKLMQSAVRNASEHLLRHKLKRSADLGARTEALAELQEGLGMDEAPLRIECIDVSHLSGTGVVASMVVFEDGLPAKGAYRKFKIERTTDDTDSIYQVVSRRMAQLARPQPAEEAGKYRDRPQLLLVDGGQPQVAAAYRALREHGVRDIALAGIAKRLEEVWLPEDPFPVIFPRTSDALFLIQRIRDEAHRFAITFQRQQRSSSIRTQLSEVPGLGEKRVTALLKHFGSVKRLREASLEEIVAVPGIGPAIAADIHRKITPESPPKTETGETENTLG